MVLMKEKIEQDDQLKAVNMKNVESLERDLE